jgi:F0F1-type ATP synthase assembly protein I
MSDDRYSGMKYAGLGLELAGAVAGLTLLGWWIDRQLESAPWGLLIGLAIGLLGGMYNLIRQVIAETRRAEAQRKKDRAGEVAGRSHDPRP